MELRLVPASYLLWYVWNQDSFPQPSFIFVTYNASINWCLMSIIHLFPRKIHWNSNLHCISNSSNDSNSTRLDSISSNTYIFVFLWEQSIRLQLHKSLLNVFSPVLCCSLLCHQCNNIGSSWWDCEWHLGVPEAAGRRLRSHHTLKHCDCDFCKWAFGFQSCDEVLIDWIAS